MSRAPAEPDYTITGVAISNQTILILCSFGFATLGIVLFLLILRKRPQHDKNNDDEQDERDNYGDYLDQADIATLNRAQRRARAKYKMKQARRDMAPAVAARGGDGNDNDNIPADDVVNDNNNAATVANRKERQRIARQMEKKERKIYSKEAKRWRDKNQVPSNSDMQIKKNKLNAVDDDDDDSASVSKFSVEDAFQQRLDKNDPLTDILFWKAIVKFLKNAAIPIDELKSRCEAAQSKAMTMREFIERVKRDGSVSIIDVADEFKISIEDVLTEVEQWYDLYSIHGAVDGGGGFMIIPKLSDEIST